MNSDLSNFYGTCAQVLPAFLILLVIETRFMAWIRRYRGINDIPPAIEAVNVMQKVLRWISFAGIGADRWFRLLDRFILRPSALTNAGLAMGLITVSIVGEGTAIGCLVDTPAGNARIATVVIVLFAMAILLMATLICLVGITFGGGPDGDPASNAVAVDELRELMADLLAQAIRVDVLATREAQPRLVRQEQSEKS